MTSVCNAVGFLHTLFSREWRVLLANCCLLPRRALRRSVRHSEIRPIFSHARKRIRGRTSAISARFITETPQRIAAFAGMTKSSGAFQFLHTLFRGKDGERAGFRNFIMRRYALPVSSGASCRCRPGPAASAPCPLGASPACAVVLHEGPTVADAATRGKPPGGRKHGAAGHPFTAGVACCDPRSRRRRKTGGFKSPRAPRRWRGASMRCAR